MSNLEIYRLALGKGSKTVVGTTEISFYSISFYYLLLFFTLFYFILSFNFGFPKYQYELLSRACILTFLYIKSGGGGGSKDLSQISLHIYKTSVSAHGRVPYAAEENLRGMTERMKERKTKTRAFYYQMILFQIIHLCILELDSSKFQP